MKTIKILVVLLFAGLAVQAQSFKGFFKPVEQNKALKAQYEATASTSTWLFRPTIGISAVKMQYVGGEQSFISTSCQTLGTGISYQKFIDQNGSPYCQLAVNGLVMYNLDFNGSKPVNLGIGATVGVFNNLVSGGLGWDFNQKYPFILLNFSLNLNK
jgi:hypothetical protein